MSIAEKLQTIAENESKVFEAGKKAEYDRFWDAYQQNGNRTHYVSAFTFLGWTDVTYQPKYPIISDAPFGLQRVFDNSQIVDTKVPLIMRGLGNIGALFNGCTYLKRIPSLILELPVTNTVNTFANCINLEEINISCVNDGCFAVSFDIHWSTKLNKASWVSIINALSSATSGLSITGSLASVKKAFETGEGANDGDTSAEWASLESSKSNWTISLV